MQTRSQTIFPIINFDEAHKEWMLNKKKRENGMFTYICGKPLSSGRLCQMIDKNDGCYIHSYRENK